MRCSKCQKDYPSRYYFETETICKECYHNPTVDEQKQLKEKASLASEKSTTEIDSSLPWGKSFDIYESPNGNIKSYKRGWSWMGFFFSWIALFAFYADVFAFTKSHIQLPGESQADFRKRLKNMGIGQSTIIKTQFKVLSVFMGLFMVFSTIFIFLNFFAFFFLIESPLGRIASIIYLLGFPIFVGQRLNAHIEKILKKSNCKKLTTIRANSSKEATKAYLDQHKPTVSTTE